MKQRMMHKILKCVYKHSEVFAVQGRRNDLQNLDTTSVGAIIEAFINFSLSILTESILQRSWVRIPFKSEYFFGF